MNRKYSLVQITLLLLSICIASVGFGQSTIHCLKDNSWLPVAEMRGEEPYCFTGDSLVRGDKERLGMLPASSFHEGFLDVEIVRNKRGGIVNREHGVQFVSSEGWYELSVLVTADRDLDDCFFVMRFDSLGDVIYHAQEIGRLKAGKAKRLAIVKRVGYEMPQQLHIYSGMEEVRTTLIPEGYSYNRGELMFASTQ